MFYYVHFVMCSLWCIIFFNISTLTLYRSEEAPVIEDPPQKYLIVSEGQKVNLTCRVYGAPKPKVVWHKTSGEQLTGGRYWVHTDGNLEIEDISLVDAGMYFCTASNRIDTVTANGELIVRRK